MVSVLFIRLFLDGLAAASLYVGNRDELHIRLLQETAEIVSAPVSDADPTQDNALARGHGPALAQDAAGNDLRCH